MTIFPWLVGGAVAGYAVGRGRRAAITHTWQRGRFLGDDFVSLDGKLLEDGERAGSIRVIPVKRVNDRCAASFQRLRRNFGNAPIYEVNTVMIEWRLQGKGHGKRFYLAAIEQLRKKHPRGFYLVSSSCGRGTTKPQALRVFNALSRQFPSTGKGWYRSLYIGPASGRGRRAVETTWTRGQETRQAKATEIGRNRVPTRRDEGTLPLDVLLTLDGSSGEHNLFASSPTGRYSKADWKTLVADVRRHGVREPVTIRVLWVGLDWPETTEPFYPSPPIFPADSYTMAQAFLWEGNHRVRAAKAAGLKEVPVRIDYFGYTDREVDVKKRGFF